MGRKLTRIILPTVLSFLLAIRNGLGGSDPTPTMWPDRFHAVLYMNLSSNGRLQITNLWYDWPKGRNLNLIQKQLGELLHDVEWNNGTSFYYTLGSTGSCQPMLFEVGIPRPDWLVGSTYLGREYTDGFLCNVWEKVDFIWYYEDVDSKRPVRWDFYDGHCEIRHYLKGGDHKRIDRMTDTVFERMGRPMRVILLSTLFMLIAITKGSGGSDPIPTMWPERFHAVLYMNLTSSGRLLMTDLWYDWPKGRNLNLMQQQLDDLLHDVEWNNGTSFYYTLGPTGSCRIRRFPVGIPRPDWLVGSTYLGQGYTDGFLCNVWEKLDFVWYYEDVETKKPVRWDFFDGISTHVMTFEVGAELEDSQWQAPSYCFNGSNKEGSDGENIESSRGLDVNGVLDFNLRKLI